MGMGMGMKMGIGMGKEKRRGMGKKKEVGNGKGSTLLPTVRRLPAVPPARWLSSSANKQVSCASASLPGWGGFFPAPRVCNRGIRKQTGTSR